MEVKIQSEEIQAFAHQHASGEIFRAENIEVARGMCPVLGSMTLEESGLLLELEAIGKAQMSVKLDSPENPVAHKPVFEKMITTVAKKDTPKTQVDIVNVEHRAETISKYLTGKNIVDDTSELGPETQSTSYDIQNHIAHERMAYKNHVDLISLRAEVKAYPIIADIDRKDYRDIVLNNELSPATNVIDSKPIEQSAAEEEPVFGITHESTRGSGEIVQLVDVLPTGSEAVTVPAAQDSMNIVDEESYVKLDQPFTVESAGMVIESNTPSEFQELISVPELPAPFEEIQLAISQLAEAMEAEELNQSEAAPQILGKIIALPAITESTSEEAKNVIEVKLEELFIQLLEQTNIQYTPQLVESFIKLTQAHHLEQLLESVKDEDFQDLPTEIGTREFLQKLQRGLVYMKQSVMGFYEIGRTVLVLCALNVPNPSLRA